MPHACFCHRLCSQIVRQPNVSPVWVENLSFLAWLLACKSAERCYKFHSARLPSSMIDYPVYDSSDFYQWLHRYRQIVTFCRSGFYHFDKDLLIMSLFWIHGPIFCHFCRPYSLHLCYSFPSAVHPWCFRQYCSLAAAIFLNPSYTSALSENYSSW